MTIIIYYTFRMFVWKSPTISHLGSTYNQLTSMDSISHPLSKK